MRGKVLKREHAAVFFQVGYDFFCYAALIEFFRSLFSNDAQSGGKIRLTEHVARDEGLAVLHEHAGKFREPLQVAEDLVVGIGIHGAPVGKRSAYRKAVLGVGDG